MRLRLFLEFKVRSKPNLHLFRSNVLSIHSSSLLIFQSAFNQHARALIFLEEIVCIIKIYLTAAFFYDKNLFFHRGGKGDQRGKKTSKSQKYIPTHKQLHNFKV